MAARRGTPQRWLFAFESPMERTFDRSFFRSLPTSPGVYRMIDARGRTLYVGKAKNLRVRVGSYRRALPGGAARKTLRLVARVRTIEWEECADERSALLRENALLRALQPPFNAQKTRPQFYGFVAVRPAGEGLVLRVTPEPDSSAETMFGAFKGIRLLRSLCQALARLAWLASGEAARLPARLAGEPRAQVTARLPVAAHSSLRRYFAGTSDELCARLAAGVGARPLGSFEAALAERDLELAREFFERSARRGWRLRRQYGLRRVIPPARIDDLLVLSAAEAPI